MSPLPMQSISRTLLKYAIGFAQYNIDLWRSVTKTATVPRSRRPGPVPAEHDALRERGLQRLVLRRRHLQQRRRHVRAAAAVRAAVGAPGDHLLEPQGRARSLQYARQPTHMPDGAACANIMLALEPSLRGVHLSVYR